MVPGGSKVSNASVFKGKKSDTIRGLGSRSFILALGETAFCLTDAAVRSAAT
jgi:hypothetical protein